MIAMTKRTAGMSHRWRVDRVEPPAAHRLPRARDVWRLSNHAFDLPWTRGWRDRRPKLATPETPPRNHAEIASSAAAGDARLVLNADLHDRSPCCLARKNKFRGDHRAAAGDLDGSKKTPRKTPLGAVNIVHVKTEDSIHKHVHSRPFEAGAGGVSAADPKPATNVMVAPSAARVSESDEGQTGHRRHCRTPIRFGRPQAITSAAPISLVGCVTHNSNFRIFRASSRAICR